MTNATATPRANIWRIAGWSLVAFLLLLPAVAMRFTAEVNWTASDFVFAAALLGGVGLGIELLVRKSPNNFYRFGAAFAVLTAFLTILANGAVGMIGNEDNRYNLLFLAVIPLALIGAALARFRPTGMALTMLAAGIAYASVALGGLATDPRGAVFSLAFACLWFLSAALLRSARDEP